MPAITVLEVPKWGLSMEEGTVVSWLVKEGDSFAEGDELCEIETSKITNIYEAPVSGTLRKILGQPGETLPVAAPLGVASDADTPDADIEAFLKTLPLAATDSTEAPAALMSKHNSDAPAEAATSASKSVDLDIPDSVKGAFDPNTVSATQHAMRFAVQHKIDLGRITGTGRAGRIGMVDVEGAIVEAGGSVPVPDLNAARNIGARNIGVGEVASTALAPIDVPDDRLRASPLARVYARQHDIPLVQCTPTDPRGRLSLDDVKQALAKGITTSEVASSHTISASSSEPLSGMRKTIATRLQKSKQEAPHFRVTMTCDVDSLLDLRKQLNAGLKDEAVSVNDFIIKACAGALMAVPDCNIQFDGQQIRRSRQADITVAVALDSGLITPKITAVDQKGVLTISREMRDLAQRARDGALGPDEFEGGTFTISNLGMFGVSQFDAIINPPQAAILAVGAIAPVLVPGDDGPRTAQQMTVTLSSDHRVIDGALAARFMSTLQDYLQNPGLMIA